MRIAVQTYRFVEVKQAVQKRIEKAKAKNLCLACLQPLDDTRVIRGCHERCYRATLRAVVAGKTTIADRIAEGKLADESKVRAVSNPVTVELSSTN